MTVSAPTIGELRKATHEIVEALERLGEHYSWDPAPDSLALREWAADDMADEWSKTPLHDADRINVLLILSAADHLRAMADAMAERTFAPMTLARSVLESSARAWFNAAPDADSRERVRRHMNARLEDIAESIRRMRAAGEKDVAKAAARQAAILESARRQGFTTQSNARIPHIGAPEPPAVELAHQVLSNDAANASGNVLYRIGAGVSHGNANGLLHFLALLEPDQVGGPARMGLIRAHPETFGRWLYGAPLAFVKASGELLVRYGYNPSGWEPRVLRSLDTWRAASLAPVAIGGAPGESHK